MARVMIVGGGCRGRQLAEALVGDGHAVRITTRSEDGRAAIEAVGAECWIGTPDRLATLRGALDSVTILCWMLGSAVGSEEELKALYTTRLEYFLTQAIDTTVRGFLYEAAGSVRDDLLLDGERTVCTLTERSAIPVAVLSVDPLDTDSWIAQARSDIAGMFTRA
ncbi:MAG: hypothetical protein ACYDHN_10260 [Solirubrobacteraceae bacterium]